MKRVTAESRETTESSSANQKVRISTKIDSIVMTCYKSSVKANFQVNKVLLKDATGSSHITYFDNCS